MPTSNYMPDVIVEIAFDSGWATPAASRTWTDVSRYVELAEGIGIAGGRSDERSTADANQLSLTLDNSDGRFTAEAERRNYALNSSLETDAAGWYDHSLGVTSATWARQTGWAHEDTYSMRQTGTSGAADVGGGLHGFVGSIVLPDGVAPGYTVAPGETWTVIGKCNVISAPPPGSPGLWAEIFWFNSGLTLISQVNGATNGATVTPGPQSVTVTATAPAGAAYMQAVVVMGTYTTGDVLDFYTDAVRVEKAAAPVSPYYPDVKIGRPIRVRVPSRTNLVTNPTLETVTTNWSGLSATIGRSNAVSPAVSGTYYGTMTQVGGGGIMAAYTAPCPLTGRGTYRVQVSVRAATIARTCQLEIYWYNISGAAASTPNTVVQVAADAVGSWTTLSGLATAPPDAASGALLVYAIGGPAAEVHHFDAAFIGEDGAYFDGTTAATDFGMTHAWTGAAHGSTSTEGITNPTRFLGFVNEWPTEWNDTSAYAKAAITASSRLSRIGTQAGLKSLVEQASFAFAPVAYYTFGEPEGSPGANDSSGYRKAPLLIGESTPPAFFGTATGPGTDSMTAVSLPAAGTGGLRGFDNYLGASALSAGLFFSTSGASATGSTVAFIQSNATITWRFHVDANGKFLVNAGVASTPAGATNVADGLTHHLAFTHDGTQTLRLYVDGVLESTTSNAAFAIGYTALISMGLATFGTVYPSDQVFAHFGLYPTQLALADIQSIASAGLTGYAGETTSARLLRYAALAAIPSAEVNAETGSTTMQHVDTTDKQVVELMRIAETTEGGVLYDERDGALTFENRAHRYTAASSYTLNMVEGEVEAGYAPRVDLTGLANDISAKDITGRFTAYVFDATSRAAYGNATASIETASESTDEPLSLATWMLSVYKDPKERVPSLEVDALSQVGKTPNAAAVMATTVGDKITVSNRPTQAATSTVDYFVEGWAETYGPESLRFSFNLSPSAPYDQVLIIDDATRGVIDTNVIGL